MNKSEQITRKMLTIIRENNSNNGKQALLTENEAIKKDSFPITKNTPQFGDVRESQEQSLIKTVGESIELGENALVYCAKNKDLVLTGKINSLSLSFQFRFNDPSGEGCYIWANALQLTETNNRTLGKVRDAFVNWKNALIQDGDLMAKLHQAATKE
jgi:hypothetical protein